MENETHILFRRVDRFPVHGHLTLRWRNEPCDDLQKDGLPTPAWTNDANEFVFRYRKMDILKDVEISEVFINVNLYFFLCHHNILS